MIGNQSTSITTKQKDNQWSNAHVLVIDFEDILETIKWIILKETWFFHIYNKDWYTLRFNVENFFAENFFLHINIRSTLWFNDNLYILKKRNDFQKDVDSNKLNSDSDTDSFPHNQFGCGSILRYGSWFASGSSKDIINT